MKQNNRLDPELFKKMLEDVDVPEEEKPSSKDETLDKAREVLNDQNTSDFIVVYLNREGGGSIGAVRANMRQHIFRVLMELMKQIAKSALEDFGD